MPRHAGLPALTTIHTPVGEIAIRLSGPADAPPLILLHGWSQSSLAFMHQLTGEMATVRRLIVPDLPGHGASPPPQDPAKAGDGTFWASFAAELVMALALDRPAVLGWSMGGWILGDALAGHGAGLFGAMMTVGTVARMGTAADPAMMEKRKADIRAEGMFDDDPAAQIAAAVAFARAMTASPLSKHDLAYLTAQMLPPSPALRRAARLRNADWRDAFARHRSAGLPALVIQGGAERVCFEPQARETAEALGAEIVTMPGTGHMPFWEQPETFDHTVLTFLGRSG
ncbi:MAG: alpha/beta hydrolase [Pseudomonadota bacterium]